MAERHPPTHVLEGFPDTALKFVRSMEARRNRLAAQHGLSGIELRAFFRIAAAGSVTPKDLAAALSVTKGAVTGVSTRLVEAGFVHRVEHPQDRRSLHLELTPAGHGTMRVLHEDFRAMLSAADADISDADLEVARTVLEALTVRVDLPVPSRVDSSRTAGPEDSTAGEHPG